MNLDIVTVFVASACIILLLVFFVLLFVLFYQKRMLAQKMTLRDLAHEHQLELLKATFETQEREQMRLAKELHDGVGALLTATKLQVQQVERHVAGNEAAAPFVTLTTEMLEESIANVRSAARNLVPPTLERFGLPDALKAFVERFSTGEQLAVTVHAQATMPRFEATTELALFRIAQELVNNTARHSQATTATLELGLDGQQVQLRYKDTGEGFDFETITPGLGLNNIESRVKLLGGTVLLDGKQGFSAIIHVPFVPLRTETTAS